MVVTGVLCGCFWKLRISMKITFSPFPLPALKSCCHVEFNSRTMFQQQTQLHLLPYLGMKSDSTYLYAAAGDLTQCKLFHGHYHCITNVACSSSQCSLLSAKSCTKSIASTSFTCVFVACMHPSAHSHNLSGNSTSQFTTSRCLRTCS